MFTKLVKSFIQDESGQGVVEYAGVMVLGAVLAVYAFTEGKALIEPAIVTTFTNAASYLTSITS